jgi:hypothetical protein
MSEWIKAVGGPVGLIFVGLTLLGGALTFVVFWLGLGLIAVGLALWLYRLERFPITVSLRGTERLSTGDRRTLLSLAQAVETELETCRYRLHEAKGDRRGWFSERNLPAETYNTRWTPSLVTADQVSINDALRAFYVWADEANHKMSRRASNEVLAIGGVLEGKSLDLDDGDVGELDDGLSRIRNAQEHLTKLTERLRTKPF